MQKASGIKLKLEKLSESAKKDFRFAKSEVELEAFRIKYLGRKSELTRILRSLSDLPDKDKPEIGKLSNTVRAEIEGYLKACKKELQNSRGQIDLDKTLPGRPYRLGTLHPITQLFREMNGIMKQMGFSVYDGPHIDSDFNVFEALNLPKHHPARDLWDTVYIESPEMMLRSQTSSLEIRAMKKEELPIRIVVPGVCFRNETPNQTNHFYFHQYEALAVGEGITMAHLKGVTRVFFKELIGPEVVVRFRNKHYPQVEPGVGIDIQCLFCGGKGCPNCKFRKWVEIGGAGMVHVNAFKAVGIDYEKYTGFAWGLGVDRTAMQKFGIKDIRDLYNGKLVYR